MAAAPIFRAFSSPVNDIWHYNGSQMATVEREQKMRSTARTAEILGGKRVLGRGASSEKNLLPIIRSGLPHAAFESVMDILDISREQAAASLGLPKRTLARRKLQARLTADESDRVYRFARITARAVDVLGNREKAARWLQKPNRALGNEIPLRLLDTDLGTRQVETILGRIEHGVYS